MTGLTRDQLQALGQKWEYECPELRSLAETGHIGPGTSTGLVSALLIAQYTDEHLNLRDTEAWRQDVEQLNTALQMCEWEVSAVERV